MNWIANRLQITLLTVFFRHVSSCALCVKYKHRACVAFTNALKHSNHTYVCVYLLCEDVFLRLKCMPVLEAFVSARLSIASVLQSATFLLQTHHLVFAHATQVPVQLAHRQTHELLV